MEEGKTAILLVNLGTPISYRTSDVYKYLIEFLTDERVIDIPWIKRQFLVRGIIVPSRVRQSARSYQEIWTPEGSPLLVYSKKVKEKLQRSLGSEYLVELGMRYQEPSISPLLEKICTQNIKELIIFPLFPQYASATTGSSHQKVMEILGKQLVIPKTIFIPSYYDHPAYIAAWCERAKEYPLEEYDHILFSFHGLPLRQLQKMKGGLNYEQQCIANAQSIAQGLQIPTHRFSYCFQSRLGKEPWLQPYASDRIDQLAKEGKKKVLVFSPSFVCDCLETIYEIGKEYNDEFKAAGGERLDLVSSLNDSEPWVRAIQTIILENLPDCLPGRYQRS